MSDDDQQVRQIGQRRQHSTVNGREHVQVNESKED